MSVYRSDDDDGLSDVQPVRSSALTRSWPSSPLSALTSSREVTTRLYNSLQQSREHEVRGRAATRQVSFTVLSPDLTPVRMTAAAPALVSHGLEEKQDGECTLNLSSHGVIGSDLQEAESDGLSQEMDLHLQKRLNRPAQLMSGRRHIDEMENVRTHLQSILRPTPAASDRYEFGDPVSQRLLNESHDSDATSNLLSAAVSLGGISELFPQFSRLQGNTSSSLSELQLLRDSLERERLRRKACEQQVVSLHNKVLQSEQQFTLAVAADRKKDVMIEQLDQMLVKVVEGWRRHQKERSEEMKLLQEEKQTAEATFLKQREALSQAEQTLSHMEVTLKKEQKLSRELLDTNKQLELQVAGLRVCVENLQNQEQKLQSDLERETEKLHTLQTELNNTQTMLKQDIQDLQQQMTLTTQQLERERSQVQQEVDLREEIVSKNQQLQKDLEMSRRERDSLRVERTLDQTRFESVKSQMEAEFHMLLEQKLNDQLSIIQEENREHNTHLREQHRKQLLDLSARHERDLQAQLDQFKTQLQEKDLKLQQLTQHNQSKLSEMQEELVSMAACKRRLEMQREELVCRLQGMMRSHWAEALRLLANQEQTESVFVPPPQWEASKTSCSPPDMLRSVTHLPASQAIVLHLSREKESGRETQTEGRSDSVSEVLNCSNSFTPLEPVLDHTNVTALSDSSALWVGSGCAEEETTCTERKMKDRNEMKESQMKQNQLNRNQSHCHENQSRVTQESDVNPHHSQYQFKAPPTREDAPPTNTSVCFFNEDRRSELQYYVSKLLERSPGDPLEEPIREQQPAEERPVSDLLRTHTTQQLHFSWSGEGGGNTVRTNLEHKPDDKTEPSVSQRGVPRVVQGRRPVGRRGGSQRVWK